MLCISSLLNPRIASMFCQLIWLLLSAQSAIINAAVQGYTRHNGFTKLLGNNFGTPTVNVTYDYVVRPFSLSYPY